MHTYLLAAVAALSLFFTAPLFAAQNELHAKIESAARETLSAVPAQPPVIEPTQIRGKVAKALEEVATAGQIEKISRKIQDFAQDKRTYDAPYKLTDIRYYKRVLINTSLPRSYSEVGTFDKAVAVLWSTRVHEDGKTENRYYIRIFSLDGKELFGQDGLSSVMLKDLDSGKVIQRNR